MNLTLASPELLAAATEAELAEYERLLTRLMADWSEIARPEQLPPPGEWSTWYCRGGRGSGKTRTGAENFARMIEVAPPGDWAVIAPTYSAARDVCIEGPSGLLKALGRAVRSWNRSLGQLVTRSGSRVIIDGADDGAPGIQGYNLRGAWCDEIGLWRRWRMAWEESLLPALRIAEPGQRPRVIATGTPKRGHPLVKLLLKAAQSGTDVVAPRPMRMRDNIDNLSAEAVAYLEQRYAGSALARQELEGELLEDVEGALFSHEQLDGLRTAVPTKRAYVGDTWTDTVDLARVVVGVDPAGTSGEDADETGIVVAGKSASGLGYVLDDRSLRASPDGWGRASIRAALDWNADCIVVERNQGGEMCEHVIRTAAQAMGVTCPRIRPIHAKVGKILRAEPVAALYQQRRVRHCGTFDALEDQMCQLVPGEPLPDHDDRVDACVHALADLMLASVVMPRFRGAA